MPNLTDLGLTDQLKEKIGSEVDLSSIARVIKEHKELYIIQNGDGEYRAEITGNMRYMAESREDFPAVGDWVETHIFDEGQAIIHRILPRFSLLERQAVGAYGEKQIIAANIDEAFIVQAVDRDFNLNRLERYIVLAHSGGIEPVIILNKIDLVSEDQVLSLEQQVSARLQNTSIFMTSVEANLGMYELSAYMKKGKTYCLIGSSGVGKSSIINLIKGDNSLKINEISSSTKKGKHTTTHRELIVLENGSILIDTPGMREIGMTERADGLEITFNDIIEYAKECRFKDCTHTDEPGCKVMEAVEKGLISENELENYKKLERQTAHFNATVAEKRKKDKEFGKMAKRILQSKKQNKF